MLLTEPLLDRVEEGVDRAPAGGELGRAEEAHDASADLGHHSRGAVPDRRADVVGLVVAMVGIERHGEHRPAGGPRPPLTNQAMGDLAQ